MSYQSIRGASGSSKSDEKLAAIQLPADLTGKRVLDLGCNEGYFCLEAKRRGATRVVGMEVVPETVEKAREHAKAENLAIEYNVGDMYQMPDGPYDFIFLFSALHYIKSPISLFRRLREVLAPGGRLILEVGVAPVSGRTVQRALRGPDERFFPSRDLLIDVWMEGFAVRPIGDSVLQIGDPIPRYVFHCTHAASTVVFIEGEGGIGKTNLSRKFGSAPLISTDELLFPARARNAPVAAPQAQYDELVSANRDISATWMALKDNPEITSYFAQAIADAILQCAGAPTIVVEGYVVSSLRKQIQKALGNEFRFWTANIADM